MASRPASSKNRWIKVFLVCGAVLVVGVPVGLFLARLYAFNRIKTAFSREKDPVLFVLPQARTLNFSEKDFPQTSRHSYSGVTVTAPWVGGVEKSAGPDKWMNINFPGNKGIGILAPDPDTMGFKGLFRGDPQKTKDLESTFGTEAGRSPFAYRYAVLASSPDQYQWGMTTGEMAALSSRLIIKAVTDAAGSGGRLYTFQPGRFEGFQFGDPAPKKHVVLEFYEKGKRDGPGYGLLVWGTQPEIDFILAHVHVAR